VAERDFGQQPDVIGGPLPAARHLEWPVQHQASVDHADVLFPARSHKHVVDARFQLLRGPSSHIVNAACQTLTVWIGGTVGIFPVLGQGLNLGRIRPRVQVTCDDGWSAARGIDKGHQ